MPGMTMPTSTTPAAPVSGPTAFVFRADTFAEAVDSLRALATMQHNLVTHGLRDAQMNAARNESQVDAATVATFQLEDKKASDFDDAANRLAPFVNTVTPEYGALIAQGLKDAALNASRSGHQLDAATVMTFVLEAKFNSGQISADDKALFAENIGLASLLRNLTAQRLRDAGMHGTLDAATVAEVNLDSQTLDSALNRLWGVFDATDAAHPIDQSALASVRSTLDAINARHASDQSGISADFRLHDGTDITVYA
jgi:hypothetical protein